MGKDTAPPPPSGDTTDMDDKETTPPTRSEDKKSVDMATSSLDEPSKIPEKASDKEKSDDEYPQGLALFFIMLGLCLAVFLIAIGKLPFRSTYRDGLQTKPHRKQTKQSLYVVHDEASIARFKLAL